MNLFMTINSNNRFTFLMILWVTLFLGNVVSAQNEFLNSSNAIPPKGSSLSTPKTFTPSVFSPSATPKPMSSSSIETNKIQFTQKNTFANPGDVFKDKLNEKEGGFDSKIFRKNQYLGDFKSKSVRKN